jgi:hypothetical protein
MIKLKQCWIGRKMSHGKRTLLVESKREDDY